jgi:beta-glucosidase-like glycosyl hydrolase
VLQDAWGWDGYVTGDCGAVEYVQDKHNYTHTNVSTLTHTSRRQQE